MYVCNALDPTGDGTSISRTILPNIQSTALFVPIGPNALLTCLRSRTLRGAGKSVTSNHNTAGK